VYTGVDGCVVGLDPSAVSSRRGINPLFIAFLLPAFNVCSQSVGSENCAEIRRSGHVNIGVILQFTFYIDLYRDCRPY